MHRRRSCHDWSAFWFHYSVKGGSFWVCLHSIILREMLGTWKMSHHRMWLKWSTALNNMPLTQACWHSSVRRSMQSMYLFSYTMQSTLSLLLHKDVTLLSKGRSISQSFSVMSTTPVISFRKLSPIAAIFVTQNGSQNCSLVWHVESDQWTQVTSTVLKSVDKVVVLKTD